MLKNIMYNQYIFCGQCPGGSTVYFTIQTTIVSKRIIGTIFMKRTVNKSDYFNCTAINKMSSFTPKKTYLC